MKLMSRHLQQLCLLIYYAALTTLLISPTTSTSMGNDAEKVEHIIGGHFTKKESLLLLRS